MLEIQHLRKIYPPKLTALDEISFRLHEGEITLLIGPNGAGKSTLMKCILGLLEKEGRIFWKGVEVTCPEARREFGYIPELPSFYSDLTVEEHIEFMARAFSIPGEQWRPERENLLQRFHLLDHRKKFGDQLSKGMQQKLSICSALIHRPRLLLFDEPLIGLDPEGILEVKQVLRELREQNCCLLVSTHILDSMDQLWDRALVLHEGRLREDFYRAETVAAGESLEERFFRATAPTRAEPAESTAGPGLASNKKEPEGTSR